MKKKTVLEHNDGRAGTYAIPKEVHDAALEVSRKRCELFIAENNLRKCLK